MIVPFKLSDGTITGYAELTPTSSFRLLLNLARDGKSLADFCIPDFRPNRIDLRKLVGEEKPAAAKPATKFPVCYTYNEARCGYVGDDGSFLGDDNPLSPRNRPFAIQKELPKKP